MSNESMSNESMSNISQLVRDTPRTSPIVRPKAPPPPLLTKLLEGTGIHFNGIEPTDIQVYDRATYRRVLTRGSLGFGEAYMDNLWDCPQLDTLFTTLLRTDIDQKLRSLPRLRLLLTFASAQITQQLLNLQSRARAFTVAERHYDIGNELFATMLDSTLSYSCGYWANANTLEAAQLAKLDMICRKLDLQPGERLLDIGCGWGGLAAHAAKHYGVKASGITVSREQLALARQRCAGLPVHLTLMDYRDLTGTYDKIASVGMFEHVGQKNYAAFFANVARLLAPNGIMLLHTIGNVVTRPITDPWIEHYIFPNGKIPSAQELTQALETHLVLRDWHEFGHDYDKTLMAWWHNFDKGWPALARSGKYNERFYRMWKYYLHVCAATFRSGQSQLWQLVLTRRGERPDYRSMRPQP